jgi:hypothetical protein
MGREDERILLRCPNCDAEIAEVPEGFGSHETLICPNCGAEVEVPDTGASIADRAADAFAAAKRTVGKLLK